MKVNGFLNSSWICH